MSIGLGFRASLMERKFTQVHNSHVTQICPKSTIVFLLFIFLTKSFILPSRKFVGGINFPFPQFFYRKSYEIVSLLIFHKTPHFHQEKALTHIYCHSPFFLFLFSIAQLRGLDLLKSLRKGEIELHTRD